MLDSAHKPEARESEGKATTTHKPNAQSFAADGLPSYLTPPNRSGRMVEDLGKPFSGSPPHSVGNAGYPFGVAAFQDNRNGTPFPYRAVGATQLSFEISFTRSAF